MKLLRLPILALCCLLLNISCKKNSDYPKDKNGLPSATQSGKETLGFMLDDEPWIPDGNINAPTLSPSYDPGYNNGVMSITAHRILSNSIDQYFGMGITGDLNFVKTPITYSLNHTGLLNVVFRKDFVNLQSTDDTTYCSGSLTLIKFDKTNSIASGTFNFTLASPSIDTIRITDGRFDVKF